MARRRGFLYRIIPIALSLLAAVCLCTGCEEKVTTVEDDITLTDGQTPEPVVIEPIEKKTIVEDSLIDIGGVVLAIPDGYVRSKEAENLYVSELYPLDASNIYYSSSDGREVGVIDGALTKEQYREAVSGALACEGDEVELIIDEFTKESIEGVPSYKIRSHYDTKDYSLQMLTYIIAASKTYVVTYTQLSDDELFADFLSDEGQLQLVKEISGN